MNSRYCRGGAKVQELLSDGDASFFIYLFVHGHELFIHTLVNLKVQNLCSIGCMKSAV